jgi:putative flippase GtrA
MKDTASAITSFLKPTDTLIRFLFVGSINTLIGLGSIYILLWAGTGYWISTFIGNGSGAVASYFLNKAFTFKSKQPFLKSGVLFTALIAICYFTSYSISRQAAQVLDSLLPFNTETAAVLFGTMLYTLLNYLGQKYIVFKR